MPVRVKGGNGKALPLATTLKNGKQARIRGVFEHGLIMGVPKLFTETLLLSIFRGFDRFIFWGFNRFGSLIFGLLI